jgi:hypothetical protein
MPPLTSASDRLPADSTHLSRLTSDASRIRRPHHYTPPHLRPFLNLCVPLVRALPHFCFRSPLPLERPPPPPLSDSRDRCDKWKFQCQPFFEDCANVLRSLLNPLTSDRSFRCVRSRGPPRFRPVWASILAVPFVTALSPMRTST